MKCRICGKRTNTIAGMAKHYRKKHPRLSKRRIKKVLKKRHELGALSVGEFKKLKKLLKAI